MARSPKVITVEVTGNLGALVPRPWEPEESEVDPGIIAAMTREAERLAGLDPRSPTGPGHGFGRCSAAADPPCRFRCTAAPSAAGEWAGTVHRSEGPAQVTPGWSPRRRSSRTDLRADPCQRPERAAFAEDVLSSVAARCTISSAAAAMMCGPGAGAQSGAAGRHRCRARRRTAWPQGSASPVCLSMGASSPAE